MSQSEIYRSLIANFNHPKINPLLRRKDLGHIYDLAEEMESGNYHEEILILKK